MGDVNSDDYYKVLGVDRGSTDQQIAKAYKKAAIKWHPDKNPNNKEKAESNFKKVSEAYEVLSDPEKKKIYDQVGKAGLEGGGGFPGGAGFHGGHPFHSGGMSFDHAQNIFEHVFGGQSPFMDMQGDGPQVRSNSAHDALVVFAAGVLGSGAQSATLQFR